MPRGIERNEFAAKPPAECVAQTCTMIPVAREVGSLRALASGGITAATGKPELPPDKEKEFRRELVLRALQKLQEEV